MKPLHQQILRFLGLKSFVAALMLASPTVQAQSVKLTAPANLASDVSTQPTLAWEGKPPSKGVLIGYQ